MNKLYNLLQNQGIKYSIDIPRKAAFITEDGLYLGMEYNQEIISGGKLYPNHLDFKNFLVRMHILDLCQDISSFINQSHMVRINDGTYEYADECAYIELPNQMLSISQYQTLQEWLDHLCFKLNKRYIMVEYHNNSESICYKIANKNNPDGTLPEDIIKDIQRTYKKDSV